MILKANIDYSKFSEAFNKIPLLAAKELRLELKPACIAIQRDAKANHRFKSKSNQLERSIRYEVAGSGLSAEIFLDEGIAKYGKYQHDGIDHSFEIKPKTRKALYWVGGGQKSFAKKVIHPGIAPDPFLYAAAKRQESFVIARIKGAVNRILEMAGLK